MLITQEVTHFYHRAKEYCVWAEGLTQSKIVDVYKALQLVVNLYQAILFVPDFEPIDYEMVGDLRKSREIYYWFTGFPFQYYQEFFHPVADKPDESVTGDISDDLMDIYIDTKEGILFYEQGNIVNAAFHWRFSFGAHWGRHATGTICAMHDYLTNK